MSLTLRVLAPDQSVFDGSADEVILPSTTGQLGILPGHVSLLAALDVGVLRVRADGDWKSIALMGGFAEVEADDVTVVVETVLVVIDDDVSGRETLGVDGVVTLEAQQQSFVHTDDLRRNLDKK